MTAKPSDAKKTSSITEAQVREFLKTHPNFLKDNSDVVAGLTPPERNLGNGIIDFQHYLVKNLQKDSEALKSRYDVLIDFCRDNMSVQAQVHKAALNLIKAGSLEQLLEALTMDLVSLFDVDVVRLAMESDVPGRFETLYSAPDASGIVFIDPGTVDAALGKKKNVLLVEDCKKKIPAGFAQIFTDCDGLVESCALLRLRLEQVDKSVMLAFGVRHAGRFHPGQGIELLDFLSQIVAHRMDRYLQELLE